MHEEDHELMELVRRNLSPQDAKDCRVYCDTEIKNAGDPVRIGMREVPMPFRGVCVFVDLKPRANWGHRAAYLLASQDFKDCVRYEEQFPPFSGEVPDPWHEVPLTA